MRLPAPAGMLAHLDGMHAVPDTARAAGPVLRNISVTTCAYVVQSLPAVELQMQAAQGARVQLGIKIVKSLAEHCAYPAHNTVPAVLAGQLLNHAKLVSQSSGKKVRLSSTSAGMGS